MTFWPKDFWPLQSLDLNPLDSSVWPHVESKACKDHNNNIEELRISVNSTWARMRNYYVRNFCKDFRPRLNCVIAAKGGCIE